MTEFLLDHYLVIKALHVVAVIAWMSGMFYLPRLFVYHTQTMPGTTDGPDDRDRHSRHC